MSSWTYLRPQSLRKTRVGFLLLAAKGVQMTPIGQSVFSSREENFFGITGHFPSTGLLLLRLRWGSLWLSHTMLILILLFHKVKEILSDFHAGILHREGVQRTARTKTLEGGPPRIPII